MSSLMTQMPCCRAQSAISLSRASGWTAPVGLPGLERITARVRGLRQLSSACLGREPERLVGGDRDGDTAGGGDDFGVPVASRARRPGPRHRRRSGPGWRGRGRASRRGRSVRRPRSRGARCHRRRWWLRAHAGRGRPGPSRSGGWRGREPRPRRPPPRAALLAAWGSPAASVMTSAPWARSASARAATAKIGLSVMGVVTARQLRSCCTGRGCCGPPEAASSARSRGPRARRRGRGSARCRTAGSATTPSMSPTTRSPVWTVTPPTSTGRPSTPRKSLRVPRTELLREKTGKPSASVSAASRTPPSMSRPAIPRCWAATGEDLAPVAEAGAAEVGDQDRSRTGPASTAWCRARLSPPAPCTVNAGPAQPGTGPAATRISGDRAHRAVRTPRTRSRRSGRGRGRVMITRGPSGSGASGSRAAHAPRRV